jgi:hypothetical protein
VNQENQAKIFKESKPRENKTAQKNRVKTKCLSLTIVDIYIENQCLLHQKINKIDIHDNN